MYCESGLWEKIEKDFETSRDDSPDRPSCYEVYTMIKNRKIEFQKRESCNSNWCWKKRRKRRNSTIQKKNWWWRKDWKGQSTVDIFRVKLIEVIWQNNTMKKNKWILMGYWWYRAFYILTRFFSSSSRAPSSRIFQLVEILQVKNDVNWPQKCCDSEKLLNWVNVIGVVTFTSQWCYELWSNGHQLVLFSRQPLHQPHLPIVLCFTSLVHNIKLVYMLVGIIHCN